MFCFSRLVTAWMLTDNIFSSLQVCAVESASARERGFQLPHTAGFSVRRSMNLAWPEYKTHPWLITIPLIAYASAAHALIKPNMQLKHVSYKIENTFYLLSCYSKKWPALQCVRETFLFFPLSKRQCSGEKLEAERSHLTTTAASPQQQKVIMTQRG